MRVLVVGGGGREHALCAVLAASPQVARVLAAPGNPGIAAVAECHPVGVEDIAGLVALALREGVDLIVPGPEAPLAAGLADAAAAAGIACCGPSAAAARLESSKAFMKAVADAAGIPTAAWAAFDDAAAARAHLARVGAPVVVKADGLAAGKGVVVAATRQAAEAAIADMLEADRFGAAGRRVILEECLVGEEVSVFALCDGTTAIPFGAAQDHKRVGEGDTGPNTGGMGAYSPAPALTPELAAAVLDAMIRPALAELARRGIPFRGFLFAGVMLTAAGPRLLEFNVRLGDPETQALLPLLLDDLAPLLLAAATGGLRDAAPRWRQAASIAVVLAARGYPDAPAPAGRIGGLEAAASIPGVRVFHAATRLDATGAVVPAGGRVLTVQATAPDLRAAQQAAYHAIDRIDWAEGFCRRDIGWRAEVGGAAPEPPPG